jgi:hypothetical protein
MKTKIAVVGSRNFTDYPKLVKSLDQYIQYLDIPKEDIVIVSGGAKGADSLAKKYAADKNYQYKEFLPDWKRYGRAAGYVRNVSIIEESNACLAFWDGLSPGTKHSIDYARKKQIETIVVMDEDNEGSI